MLDFAFASRLLPWISQSSYSQGSLCIVCSWSPFLTSTSALPLSMEWLLSRLHCHPQQSVWCFLLLMVCEQILCMSWTAMAHPGHLTWGESRALLSYKVLLLEAALHNVEKRTRRTTAIVVAWVLPSLCLRSNKLCRVTLWRNAWAWIGVPCQESC